MRASWPVVIFLTIASPYFATGSNISSVIRQTSVITLMAWGMTVVIASGGIDLSVGSMVGLTGVVGPCSSPGHHSTFVRRRGAILTGMVCGIINARRRNCASGVHRHPGRARHLIAASRS